jgi:hypothetical protein
MLISGQIFFPEHFLWRVLVQRHANHDQVYYSSDLMKSVFILGNTYHSLYFWCLQIVLMLLSFCNFIILHFYFVGSVYISLAASWLVLGSICKGKLPYLVRYFCCFLLQKMFSTFSAWLD